MESEYRIRAKDIGLTFSRCDIPKEEILIHLKLILGDKVSYLCVSQETHKDGGKHLHAQLQFYKEYDSKNTRVFDYMGYHPSIEKIRNSEDWNKYVKKEGNVTEWGTFKCLLKKKEKKKIDNMKILTGDLISMINNNEINVLSLPSILNARKLYQEISASTNPIILPGVNLPDNWKTVTLPVYPTTHKQRHYWLYSDMPNMGKSTYLKKLFDMYRASYYSCQEKFQSLKADSQFVLFDEYGKGNSVTITALNQMCDGTYQYPCKGRPALTLDHPYIIICSNYPISFVYPNSNGRVEARFNEIRLDYLEFI